MSKVVAGLLVVLVLTEHVAFALGSRDAAYFGGTLSALGNAKDPVEGRLDTSNEEALIFAPFDKDFAGKTVRIPYSGIVDLEYGQKAGRRVGAAVATTVLLGPIGLVSLFSKKRKHFLTVGFKDEAGKDQVAVLELGKDVVRTTLAIVRAGDCEYASCVGRADRAHSARTGRTSKETGRVIVFKN
jgi:hypothetical protein